mgnify:CR=1 FL=1
MELLNYFQQHELVFIAAIGLLGLLIGSFLNVVVYRLPIMLQRDWRKECLTFLEQKDEQTSHTETFNLSQPRSRCPSCNHLISAAENIPIISYLILRGRCKQCDTSISARYPIVELITALLSIVVALRFGVSLQTLAALLFTWTLISLALIDVDTQLLPDSITLPLLWLGLFLSLFDIFIDSQGSIIGALAGYLSLWSVYHLFKLLTGKEGMGYGDFKLLAVIGAWLGWQVLPLVIMLSAFVGACVGLLLIVVNGRDKNMPLSFGPYLAMAAFIGLLWGDIINTSYFNLVSL